MRKRGRRTGIAIIMGEVIGFEQFIVELKRNIDECYIHCKIRDKMCYGIDIKFPNGYEILFDNHRMLRSYELYKSGQLSLQDCFKRICNVIDRGLEERRNNK